MSLPSVMDIDHVPETVRDSEREDAAAFRFDARSLRASSRQ